MCQTYACIYILKLDLLIKINLKGSQLNTKMSIRKTQNCKNCIVIIKGWWTQDQIVSMPSLCTVSATQHKKQIYVTRWGTALLSNGVTVNVNYRIDLNQSILSYGVTVDVPLTVAQFQTCVKHTHVNIY